MLIKLAFKNVGKSIRDFTVYFFTLAFGVCVFYMFNSIYAQQAMFDMTEKKTEAVLAVCQVLSYVSVFVAVILGFLIVYANRFFIKRRKRELGIYMTLGMGKRKISFILLLETSLIAVIALVVGILGGIFLSQFMSVFTAKIFEVDMTSFEFVFSFDAMMKSIMYFGIVFLVVIVFNVISVSQFKLIDLIYGARKNQKLKIRNTKVNTILCILSMAILGAAYYLIIDNGMLYINIQFFEAIILGIIGTVLFFFSLSGLLTVLISKNKNLYYKNLNMFVVRQLGSNINTNFISISVVSIVLLLTIGTFASGYGIQSVYSNTLKNMALYDYSFESDMLAESYEGLYMEDYEIYNYSDLSDLEEFIKNNEYVSDYAICKEYYSNTFGYGDFGIDLPENCENMEYISISYVSLSDYNKMVNLIGKDKLELEDNQYALLSSFGVIDSYFQEVINTGSEIDFNGEKLSAACWINGAIENVGNGIMIVPDKIVEKTKSEDLYIEILNLTLNNIDDTSKFQEQLYSYDIEYIDNPENANKSLYFSSGSKKEFYDAAVNTTALLSFLGIYLGIVFMVTCAAILSIQQLTEANENKYRYELLSKLGVDKRMMNKALFVQILCYFIFPLVLATVDSVFGLIAVQKTLAIFAMMDIGATLLPTGLFVGVLYAAYFLLTYISSKSIINKKVN